ncbi:MAG: hypothetical protein E7270_00675 [Lachnospiraceae bacterium]|nr:hypothetical protein [Lachnospiraceae bacterium]MBQ4069626.1 hypothetical protein [Lachnospiraceae bacterium]
MEFLVRVNNMVPVIFDEIIRQYNFNFMRVDSTVSILYKNNYAFVLSVDRDYVDLNFMKKEDDKIIKYWIQGFVIKKLDEDDRCNTQETKNLENKLIDYLLIYEKSLKTKCRSILMGQMDWVEDYRKDFMCVIRELNAKEYDKYGKFLSSTGP